MIKRVSDNDFEKIFCKIHIVANVIKAISGSIIQKFGQVAGRV